MSAAKTAAILTIVLSLASVAWVRSDDPPGTSAEPPPEKEASAGGDSLPTLAAARDQARLLYRAYSTTLGVLHDHYFHGDRAIVPARAMEDVFDEMETSSRVQARWISVNTNAMSVSHEPRSDFEKKAAAEISSGKREWEALSRVFIAGRPRSRSEWAVSVATPATSRIFPSRRGSRD